MAQRTGAERFLAPAAKTASARATLALAVAALLLAGCGGGSSDSGSSGTGTSSSTASAAGSSSSKNPASASPGESKSAGKPGEEGSEEGKDPTSQAGSPAAGQGQKRGPSIAQPSGPREQAPTSDEVAQATVADLTMQSPAIVAGQGSPGHLAATYTCDGKGTWPALSWQGVPADTAELALFVMNLQPVEGKIFFDWAVAGLDPGLASIQAGQLPAGAVVGTNGFGKRGYEICPPGPGEAYMLAVYALPRSLSPQRGFDPAQLRSEILAQAGNAGFLPAIYARG